MKRSKMSDAAVTPLQKRWFRVEQDSSGAILSCTEVEARGRKGAHVRFYEAADAADASAQAKAWYENYRDVARRHYARPEIRDKIKARRAKANADARSSGLCIACRVAPLKTKNHCAVCAERFNARASLRRKGLPVPPRKDQLTPNQVRQNRIAQNRKNKERYAQRYGSCRAREFLLLLSRFDSQNPRDFRTWLTGKITQLGGSQCLAEYEQKRAEQLDKKAGDAYKRSAKLRRVA